MTKRLIVCADDFGLDPAVNEAVERASRDGILTCTSLMVAAPAAADAVARAKRLSNLRVGLHLTLVDGKPLLPPGLIPDLVDEAGNFRNNMAGQGARFFFLPHVRRQLKAEIAAQFDAFAATGLTLDHANAHKHFHVHPTIASLMIEIGRRHGLKAVRVPLEPSRLMRRAGVSAWPVPYAPWLGYLRLRLHAAGMATNDAMLGLRWTGGMTEKRLLRLLAVLPEGVSELYCHPATMQTASLARAMPTYQPAAELAALLSPRVRDAARASGAALCAYGDLAA